jgi:rhamnosyltransferase
LVWAYLWLELTLSRLSLNGPSINGNSMSIGNKSSAHFIGAVIVLYYPDHIELSLLATRIRSQVAKVIFIDNTPELERARENELLINSIDQDLYYLSLADNMGVGHAQNVGIEYALASGCDHIFLLDQDSDITHTIVSELLDAEDSLIAAGENPGVIGPLFLEKKTGEFTRAIRHSSFSVKKIKISPYEVLPQEADYLISSGSLIRKAVIDQVGLLRADLFIDWVDLEWGLRASRLGFTNFIIPSVRMSHSIGDGIFSFMDKKICLHNDLRNFYIVRNAAYLFLDPNIDLGWRLNIFMKFPIWIVFYTLTSKSKMKAFLRLSLGIFYGFQGRLGRYK